MQEIKHCYTIQWVGPFKSYEKLKEFRQKYKDKLVSDPGLFSFYFFRGNKKWKRDTEFFYFGKYSGIKSILDRLNKRHEHFRNFHENENLDIWIGSLSNQEWQTPEIVDYIETVFIQRYKSTLNENKDKKAKEFDVALNQSITIINLWYDTDEYPYSNRENIPFDDVIVYEKYSEELEPRLLGGRLRIKRKPD